MSRANILLQQRGCTAWAKQKQRRTLHHSVATLRVGGERRAACLDIGSGRSAGVQRAPRRHWRTEPAEATQNLSKTSRRAPAHGVEPSSGHIGATNGHLESWSWCEHACVVGSRELIAHTEHMQRPMSSAMQGHMLSSGGFLSLVPMRGNLV